MKLPWRVQADVISTRVGLEEVKKSVDHAKELIYSDILH
mgnify:FL=1|jgi:hypothetical protein